MKKIVVCLIWMGNTEIKSAPKGWLKVILVERKWNTLHIASPDSMLQE
jgi:hypothetical protein